jgi:hypothetical protein
MSPPRILTSAASHSTLLRSITASPRPLEPLGMRISEHRALLKRGGRLTQHQRQLRCAHPLALYKAFSSPFRGFDSLRVHSVSNDATPNPTALAPVLAGNSGSAPAFLDQVASGSGETASQDPLERKHRRE